MSLLIRTEKGNSDLSGQRWIFFNTFHLRNIKAAGFIHVLFSIKTGHGPYHLLRTNIMKSIDLQKQVDAF